ncbi:bifunctional ADP-dependent NAD(P)H-hydrate dehydratase/NAD(P)H-hydrate epimerase [Thiomicrorhabdus arctica]|uniref:bifunctional ADP-dependent NAD(P)H-hydrate dehydratase/NAD(P)H-hydrate epimerase n=1 Tax=Thiomicrorhabdus arctica TaxID=131540 RepID=UPI00036DF981|nr:bifunctional ADP-dependent NAD(P)H-hydrate dehydratase/NAD(P)H-hydrate epimerase [Thiomicrorhabdus arctica]
MLRFHTAHQSQIIDQIAIKERNIPGILLMKRAGLFAFETLQHHFSNPQSIVVFCGTGHNGGDGFVVAQLALLAGMEVHVLLHGNPESIQGDALIAYQEMLAVGMTTSPFAESIIIQADVLVDALFGTGLNRPISGQLAKQIQWLNHLKKPVLALDTPSGLHADTGAILGQAIHATHTCTFMTRKLGLHTFQGTDTAGKVHYSRLFLPLEILQSQSPLALNHPLKYWMNKLPERLASQHKGVAGTVCLVGGNHSMMGAIQLAGLASLKVGAGLVKVITHSEHTVAITQSIPELMCYQPEELTIQANLANVVGIGPGLGLDDWAKTLYQQVLDVPLPKVVDADALKLLALNPQKHSNWVLTPHPGEAALLLNMTTPEIQANRIQAIKALQQKYGGVIVLKGNGSLMYDGKHLEICLAGNPGMAVGGMGDVLTGTIATFIAQGLSLWDATCLGVSLHAHAGDVLAQQKGQPGILPSELASVMSQLMSYRD